ncbi:alpha/beta hydrolase, partial [Klebsiella pneumoniae]
PAAPRAYQTTIITNANSASTEMEIRTTRAGKTDTTVEKLQGMHYLPDVYSLSHVALPFPLSDSLYGRYPHPLNQYGISLGTFAARGERSVLVVGLDSLMRQSSNPFFPYMIKRIDEGIDTPPALSGK